MIFYWFILAWRKLKWLVTPVAPRDVAQINPLDACPACGHRDGTIRCVHRGSEVLVQHTCGTCGARYHEKPVVSLTNDRLWAAVPRTEIERKEESSTAAGAVAGMVN